MSTNIFTGFTNDKTSSRITHPPGGYSNNIFGGPVEDTTASKSKPAAAATPSSAQQTTSQPQTQPQTTQTPQKKEEPQPAPAPAPARRVANHQMRSNIVFGYDEPTPAPSNAKPTTNPITGQTSNAPTAATPAAATVSSKPSEEPKPDTAGPNERKIHTSSKVLQPPGGKSHQLW